MTSDIQAIEASARLEHQFRNPAQQRETAELGMWVFLMTEALLFGALFTGFTAYRFIYPQAFAEASRHLEATLAAVMTLVLISSSLAMALAAHGAQTDGRKKMLWGLGCTILLGIVFLALKGLEYYHHYEHGEVPGLKYTYSGAHAAQAEMFFFLYFAMTGLHAIHMMIGIGIVTVMLWRAYRGAFSSAYYNPVEITGLYWHFVDIVWIFLFPVLYLLSLHR